MNGKLNLKILGLPYGLMGYWNKIENASQYIVKLYIGTSSSIEDCQEISMNIVDRHQAYYTFTNLGAIAGDEKKPRIPHPPVVVIGGGGSSTKNTITGCNYYILVEAEDKHGNIIAISELTMGKIILLV